MSTNFYFGDDEQIHIGKRSAAGNFCWDCGVSLCNFGVDTLRKKTVYGTDGVHLLGIDWLDACPLCGAKPMGETLMESTAGRELGFNKNSHGKKAGVSSCCSFTWAISPKEFSALRKFGVIFDEYGRSYSNIEFVDVLCECPIKYYHFVGKEFC